MRSRSHGEQSLSSFRIFILGLARKSKTTTDSARRMPVFTMFNFPSVCSVTYYFVYLVYLFDLVITGRGDAVVIVFLPTLYS